MHLPNPKALRTHILRSLGPKTLLCRALGYFEPKGKGPNYPNAGYLDFLYKVSRASIFGIIAIVLGRYLASGYSDPWRLGSGVRIFNKEMGELLVHTWHLP